ncbi:MAG: hypothetical protein JWR15_870 [Prosthecobacter sp.]|nr:hypothetical protein [Prosthecobacter sp.]
MTKAPKGLGMRRSGWLTFAALMAAPTCAVYRLPLNGWWLYGILCVVSAFTYLAYALDKRRAQTNAWRIPELHLHLMELVGGWPGAWVAQRRLRHKSSKTSYLVVFWLIVLIYQIVAFDSLLNWPMWSELMRRIN